ncbi:MAG TPA: type VI secretion system accessory protein TagJ [Myxococcales bacterium]|jgi:type VI secretion system protein ImpE
MTFDEAMQHGEVRQAAEEIERDLAGDRVPAKLFMLFQLKAVLEDFGPAQAALDEIRRLQPHTAPLLDELARCLAADRERVGRRHTPELAEHRHGVGAPAPFQLALVKAAVLFAQKDKAGAAAAVAEARTLAPKVPGTLTPRAGEPVRFLDLSDSDDLLGPVLETVGPQGVVDLPFCQLRSVKLRLVNGFQDSLWIPAEVELADGRSIGTRLPAQYTGSGNHGLPAVRLGNATMWDREGGLAVGFGQRDLRLTTTAGETVVGLRQVARIDFDAPAGTAAKKGFWQRLFS